MNNMPQAERAIFKFTGWRVRRRTAAIVLRAFIMRVARSTLWRLGRFSTFGRKPVNSQLTPADIKKVETSKRLRKEVANIEIPIMQET